MPNTSAGRANDTTEDSEVSFAEGALSRSVTNTSAGASAADIDEFRPSTQDAKETSSRSVPNTSAGEIGEAAVSRGAETSRGATCRRLVTSRG